jgi:hypothetical protein
MRHEISGYTVHLGLLAALVGLLMAQGARAEGARGNDGSVVLRMCKGADKVKALSVMCHSYLNGYLDAARHYGKPGFCLEDSDKEKAAAAVVEWIEAHPEAQSQPAGTVLTKALSEKFSCKGRK